MGAKKAPFYRVVVADARAPRDGRFIDEIGYYNPTKDPAVLHIEVDKARLWLGRGAQPSETVRALLRRAGVI
jgi:small subunit ribosomal protein S16